MNETPIRFLVVDDQENIRRLCLSVASGLGFQCSEAASAEDALARVECDVPDIVLSDLGLPDMTGHDLMRQLKDQYGFKGIAMSGYGMEEDIKQSKAAGFSEHLVKPMNLEQLAQSIERLGGE